MKNKILIVALVSLGVALAIFVYLKFVAVEYLAFQTSTGEVVWLWVSTLSCEVSTPLILVMIGSFAIGAILIGYKIGEFIENAWKSKRHKQDELEGRGIK